MRASVEVFSLPFITIADEVSPDAGFIISQSGNDENCQDVLEHSTLKLSVNASGEVWLKLVCEAFRKTPVNDGRS